MTSLRFATVLAFAACAPEMPGRVFVPGDGFSLTLSATSSAGESPTVRVGEPLTLQVRRTSGPWQEASGEIAVPGGCWYERPAEPVEPAVADNVRWLVEPSGAAAFNTGFRADHTREVRFDRPGDYLLIATEAGSCAEHSTSDTLRVRVLPEGAGAGLGAGSAGLAPDRGCIRGGSTREEVRAVMGEPDSVSFGAWVYGRSSVTFGYGTVVDLDNQGGELRVCRDG